jgi:hypothetical protein
VLRVGLLIALVLASSGATTAGARPSANPILYATVGTNDGFDVDSRTRTPSTSRG